MLTYDGTNFEIANGIPNNGGAGGGYATVKEEGTALTQRTTVDFVGRGVIADDFGSETRVRIDDPTTMTHLFDEFLGGTNSSGSIGELGWLFSGGTAGSDAVVAGRPGILRRNTSTSANTIAITFMLSSSSDEGIAAADTWNACFSVRPDQAIDNTTVRVGLVDNSYASSPPTDGIYFETLSTDGTRNWFFVTRAASSETRADSGTLVSITNFVKLCVRRKDASTVSFSINGGAETDATLTIPTVGLRPWTQIVNVGVSTAKVLQHDYFDLLITGLSR